MRSADGFGLGYSMFALSFQMKTEHLVAFPVNEGRELVPSKLKFCRCLLWVISACIGSSPVTPQLGICTVCKVATQLAWICNSLGKRHLEHFREPFKLWLKYWALHSEIFLFILQIQGWTLFWNYGQKWFWKCLPIMSESIHNTHMLPPENLYFSQRTTLSKQAVREG